MSSATEPEPPRPSPGKRHFLVVAVAVLSVVAFGLLTTLLPDRVAIQRQPTEAPVLVEPEVEAGFRPVAKLKEGPWESFRIADAYLFMGERPTIISDDDQVLEVALPGVEHLFGAFTADGESIAFGRSSDGPAIWRSPDTASWTLERLPWDGTVRAGAEIDGRLVLLGIRRDGASFHFVTAIEAESDWLVMETSQVPDTRLISVPGGFLGRGNATDGSGFGYLYSADGLEWTFQSSLAAIGTRSVGQIPSFVVETDDSPMLQLPRDDRILSPPAWPVSGLWIEGDVIWVQTPGAAWSTNDGEVWHEYPINASTGIGGGFSVLLPVGDTVRLATSAGEGFTLLRWHPGTNEG